MQKGENPREEKPKVEVEPKVAEKPKVEAEPKAAKKQKVVAEPKLITVHRFVTLPRNGGVVVFDDDGVYYHIKDGSAVNFVRNAAEVSSLLLVKCHDWRKEIDAMLPDRKTVIANIHRSILRAGGVRPGVGNESRYLNTAFNMYSLPHEKKEK